MERNYKYKTRTENWINGFDLGPVYEAAAEFQIKWFHSYHNIQHLQILQPPSNAVSDKQLLHQLDSVNRFRKFGTQQ